MYVFTRIPIMFIMWKKKNKDKKVYFLKPRVNIQHDENSVNKRLYLDEEERVITRASVSTVCSVRWPTLFHPDASAVAGSPALMINIHEGLPNEQGRKSEIVNSPWFSRRKKLFILVASRANRWRNRRRWRRSLVSGVWANALINGRRRRRW